MSIHQKNIQKHRTATYTYRTQSRKEGGLNPRKRPLKPDQETPIQTWEIIVEYNKKSQNSDSAKHQHQN